MNAETLKALGLSPAMIEDRVVESAVERLLEERLSDEDGRPAGTVTTRLAERMKKTLQERADAAVDKWAQEVVLPRLDEMIANVTLQETNRWGEVKKELKPVTLKEYLVQRAEEYLTDRVDERGKRIEKGAYQYEKGETRLQQLVAKHFRDVVSGALSDAVVEANKILCESLEKTAKIQLGEIAAKLRVDVSVGR